MSDSSRYPHCPNCGFNTSSHAGNHCPMCGESVLNSDSVNEPEPFDFDSVETDREAAMRAAVEVLRENATGIIGEAESLVAPEMVVMLEKIKTLTESDDSMDKVKARFICMMLSSTFCSLLITLLNDPQEAIQQVVTGALAMSAEVDDVCDAEDEDED